MLAHKQGAILLYTGSIFYASSLRRKVLDRPQGGGIDGPCRIRTYNQRIMLTTTAFAALLTEVESEFVVWTISSLYVSAASFSPYLSMMN